MDSFSKKGSRHSGGCQCGPVWKPVNPSGFRAPVLNSVSPQISNSDEKTIQGRLSLLQGHRTGRHVEGKPDGGLLSPPRVLLLAGRWWNWGAGNQSSGWVTQESEALLGLSCWGLENSCLLMGVGIPAVILPGLIIGRYVSGLMSCI